MISVGKRPPRHRGAYVRFDVPAAALVAGGAVYHPSPSGAVIAGCVVAPDTGASPWRWGLMAQAAWGAFVAGGGFGDVGGGPTITPLWPDPNNAYTIMGEPRSGQFFGLGDQFPVLERDPYTEPILVMPGNVFVLALTTANIIAEGAFVVHEFTNPDEFQRWTVGNGE